MQCVCRVLCYIAAACEFVVNLLGSMWMMEFPLMAQDLNMARGVERQYVVSRARVGR